MLTTSISDDRCSYSWQRSRKASFFSRRDFLRWSSLVGLGGVTLPAVGCGRGTGGGQDESKTLVLVSYGGSWNDDLNEAVVRPFVKRTGIDVQLAAGADLSRLRLQVESGDVQWDIVDLTGAQFHMASRDGLLERYDYDVVDTSKVPDSIEVFDHGLRYASYLFLMAWDARRVDERQGPSSWAEFWDTESLPGTRSLYDNLTDGSMLEAALVADGVPFDPAAVYPIDVDRALGSLDAITAEAVWHSSNQEPIQQLTTSQVPLATSWIARVFSAKQDGARIGWTTNQGFVTGSYLAVPKGAPHVDAAWRFLDFLFTNDRAAAEFTKRTLSPISNQKAIALLPAELQSQLPISPEVQDRIVVKDDAWWADNFQRINKKFKAWQVQQDRP